MVPSDFFLLLIKRASIQLTFDPLNGRIEWYLIRHIRRKDLATWIVCEVCCGISIGNIITNITETRRFY